MRELVNLIWSENSLLGQMFILLVTLTSFCATGLALYHIWRYRVFETSSLMRLKGILERWKKNRQAKPDELFSLKELKDATPAKSLIHHCLLTIERMRDTNVKVDFEALQQITFAAESSQLGLRAPAFAVSFVLLLGLFGSIVSLCLTLAGMSHAEMDPDATFGAMTASFASGLAGLLGSLWVSLFNLGLTTAQASFFEKLERFTVEDLLPQTVPDIRHEAWLRQMQYKIGESFERIKEIAEQNNQTVKDFEVVAEGFSRLVDNLEQSARKGASADVQKVLGQLGQVIGQVTRANESALSLANSVPKALESARGHNQNVLARLDALSQKTNEQHEKLTRLVATTNEKLPQTLQSWQQSNQTVTKRLEEALSRTSGPKTAAVATALPLPAQVTKLLLYAVPLMFLLILLVLFMR